MKSLLAGIFGVLAVLTASNAHAFDCSETLNEDAPIALQMERIKINIKKVQESLSDGELRQRVQFLMDAFHSGGVEGYPHYLPGTTRDSSPRSTEALILDRPLFEIVVRSFENLTEEREEMILEGHPSLDLRRLFETWKTAAPWSALFRRLFDQTKT